MHPSPQHRTVLNWLQPTDADRYEIYSELGLPQAVLTITSPTQALIESRFGVYQIERRNPSGKHTVSDAGQSLIATIHTDWWGNRELIFHDGRELHFRTSGLFRSRWLWSSSDGEPQAVVQHRRIFFSPHWPIGEGLSALLAGLSIYLIATQSTFFSRFPAYGFK